MGISRFEKSAGFSFIGEGNSNTNWRSRMMQSFCYAYNQARKLIGNPRITLSFELLLMNIDDNLL